MTEKEKIKKATSIITSKLMENLFLDIRDENVFVKHLKKAGYSSLRSYIVKRHVQPFFKGIEYGLLQKKQHNLSFTATNMPVREFLLEPNKKFNDYIQALKPNQKKYVLTIDSRAQKILMLHLLSIMSVKEKLKVTHAAEVMLTQFHAIHGSKGEQDKKILKFMKGVPLANEQLASSLGFWPHSKGSAQRLYKLLLAHSYIEPNPHFFNYSFNKSHRRTTWLGKQTELVYLFHLIYGNRFYKNENVHSIITKLFVKRNNNTFTTKGLATTHSNLLPIGADRPAKPFRRIHEIYLNSQTF